jgi:hypothetical protein
VATVPIAVPAPVKLPVVQTVDAATLNANFLRIKQDVATLVKEEMRRILADPKLKHLIVK